MTIDEEIVLERKLADYYKDNHLKNEAREHVQRAEWLEELKMLRELKEEHRKIGNIEGFNKGYNKAIDDFIRKCEMESRVILDEIIHLSYYGLSMRELQRIAEQLKEGGNINE